MSPSVRRRSGDGDDRATTLELFYDLVFVFAITQVSHLLLAHLTWTGAGQATLILLVVHWSWNFTTWATNELDPEQPRVRLLLLLLMFFSLLMAVAIPRAFGDRGLLFVVAYVAIQLLRHGFLTFVAAAPGTNERERAGRILAWFVAAGVLWIAGGLVDGTARTLLWVAALAIDYGGALVTFWIPGRRHLTGDTWEVTPAYMAERFQLFVIIALGESVVVTGATAAGTDLDLAGITTFALAFLSSATFWWLYFTSVGRIMEATLERSDDQTILARDIYTYLHVILIAGIVVSAVGDEVVLAHPTEVLGTPELIALITGPVLYLLAQILMRLRVVGDVSRTRATGVAGCLAAGVVGAFAPALVVAALLAAVLVGLVIDDELHGREPEAVAEEIAA